MPKTLKITLKKSMIGRPEKHRRTVRSLGLRKLNKTVVLNDTPEVRGMVKKVSHLLEVEETAMKLHELSPPKGARKAVQTTGTRAGFGARKDRREGFTRGRNPFRRQC